VRRDVNGETVDDASVHLARHSYRKLREADIVALTTFVQERNGPLILAGDFNMAPRTHKLETFTKITGFGRFDIYAPTWPVRWQTAPLLPLIHRQRLCLVPSPRSMPGPARVSIAITCL